MRLPDLLATLANCENARAFSIYDRCKAWYVHRPGGVQRGSSRRFASSRVLRLLSNAFHGPILPLQCSSPSRGRETCRFGT
jgi:hypothetical protein